MIQGKPASVPSLTRPGGEVVSPLTRPGPSPLSPAARTPSLRGPGSGPGRGAGTAGPGRGGACGAEEAPAGAQRRALPAPRLPEAPTSCCRTHRNIPGGRGSRPPRRGPLGSAAPSAVAVAAASGQPPAAAPPHGAGARRRVRSGTAPPARLPAPRRRHHRPPLTPRGAAARPQEVTSEGGGRREEGRGGNRWGWSAGWRRGSVCGGRGAAPEFFTAPRCCFWSTRAAWVTRVSTAYPSILDGGGLEKIPPSPSRSSGRGLSGVWARQPGPQPLWDTPCLASRSCFTASLFFL